MALNDNRPMAARLSAFIVWAALAASVVFWALRLAGGSPSAPSHTVPVGDVTVPHADLTRLFGAEPKPSAQAEVAAPMSSRFRLIGLAAPRVAGAPGVALISVDGKTPRAYRLGAVVDSDLVLQSVERRSVNLGLQGRAPVVRLELPPLPPAATGTLPPAVNQDTPNVPPAMAQPPVQQAMPVMQQPVPPPSSAQQPLAVSPGHMPMPQPGSRPPPMRAVPGGGVSPTGANPSQTEEAPMLMPGAPVSQ